MVFLFANMIKRLLNMIVNETTFSAAVRRELHDYHKQQCYGVSHWLMAHASYYKISSPLLSPSLILKQGLQCTICSMRIQTKVYLAAASISFVSNLVRKWSKNGMTYERNYWLRKENIFISLKSWSSYIVRVGFPATWWATLTDEGLR